MSLRRKTVWPFVFAAVGAVVVILFWQRQPSVGSRSEQTSPNAGLKADSTAAKGLQGRRQDEALLVALAQADSERNPELQVAALSRIVANIPTVEIAAALIATVAETNRVAAELRQMLLRRWTRENAPSAASWVAQHFSGTGRGDALNVVAATWAASDPPAAEQWARGLAEPNEQSATLLTIAREMTRENPAAALSMAADLPAGESRDEFLAHAAAEWASQDSHSAVEWGKQVADESLRADLLAAIATGFAENNPSAAATLVAQSLPAGRAQDDAVVSIVQRWVQQSPEEASSWATAFPNGPLRDTALDTLVKLWADQDITAAGAWINSLGTGPGSDIAIAAYVEKSSVQFPEMAAEWAQEIRDAQLRDAKLVQLAELWLRSDAPAARQWLAQAPLPQETKSRLLAPAAK